MKGTGEVLPMFQSGASGGSTRDAAWSLVHEQVDGGKCCEPSLAISTLNTECTHCNSASCKREGPGLLIDFFIY